MKKIKYNDEQIEKLEEQVRSEYNESETHILNNITDWRVWLKLYANRRKNAKAVGDNTLFVVHQTFLAAVYNDKLAVDFLPREYGDIETAETLTMVAEYDHDKMGKADVDYDWLWNTLFFGRGVVDMSAFDTDEVMPVPKVWDPLNTFPDPYATSINGINGDGASRFIGRMVGKTKWQMDQDGVENTDGIGNWSPDSQITETKQARDDARGLTYVQDKLKGDSKLFNVLEWYTFFEGKWIKVYAGQKGEGKEKETIILKTIDIEDKKLPLIDRAVFPIPGEWYGVSIPMLVEDKQRALAKLKNITIDGVESAAYNRFAYNADKIKSKRDLDIGADKHIAIDGAVDGAIVPLPKPGVAPGLDFVLSLLDRDTQTASATPDIKQGVATRGSETLGELKMIGQASASRYGLSIKLFELSEKRFWRQWYWLYKKNFNSLKKKAVRITGTYGVEFRELTKENITCKKDPDVKIRSKGIKKQEQRDRLSVLTSLTNLVMADESINKREFMREMLSASGYKTDGINRILPQSPDELYAEDENKKLSKNEPLKARIDEDHNQHILVHRRAAETPAKQAHIEKHKAFLIEEKKDKKLQPQEQDNNRARAPIAQFNNLPPADEQPTEV